MQGDGALLPVVGYLQVHYVFAEKSDVFPVRINLLVFLDELLHEIYGDHGLGAGAKL